MKSNKRAETHLLVDFGRHAKHCDDRTRHRMAFIVAGAAKPTKIKSKFNSNSDATIYAQTDAAMAT